ncbi:O-methyltransferase [Colletotrichum zoysiae]|uniref:O-methyltransferase n=1 Tax=Colletotrichum zoysiae TaxID=1216348 RepID=A0AAD9HR33_9PEZI|nr:O-methyltransferase [Colletotrichum zoysiae]
MPSSTASSVESKGKLKLTGSEETLLLTLLARAHDAASPRPVLNDRYALELVTQIRERGYDFERTSDGGPAPKYFGHSVAMRGRMLDICTEEFLRKSPGPATVLHIACGLDTRSTRIRWQGEGRLWIDADLEEVVKLRRDLMKEPEGGKGEYRLMHPNILEDGWLSECNIPTDRPVLVLFEGLSLYLTPDEFHGFLQRTVDYYHSSGSGVHGEMCFDAAGSFMYRLINYRFGKALKLMGARVAYYLNDPKGLEKKVPGLKYQGRIFKTLDLHKTWSVKGLVVTCIDLVLGIFGLTNRIGGAYRYEF